MQRCSSVQFETNLLDDGRHVISSSGWPVYVNEENGVKKDHFIMADAGSYAGTHLIVDFWGVRGVDDLDIMEATLKDAVEASGATLLHIHLHHFSPNGGISGVAVLAESHITVHTWPEYSFAAFDIFMCGSCDPHKGLMTIERRLEPERICVKKYIRGASSGHEDIQGTSV